MAGCRGNGPQLLFQVIVIAEVRHRTSEGRLGTSAHEVLVRAAVKEADETDSHVVTAQSAHGAVRGQAAHH